MHKKDSTAAKYRGLPLGGLSTAFYTTLLMPWLSIIRRWPSIIRNVCIRHLCIAYLVMKIISSTKAMQQQQVCGPHCNVGLKDRTADTPWDEVQTVSFTSALHQHLNTQPQQLWVLTSCHVC